MFTRWLLILTALIAVTNCSRESEPAEKPIVVKPKSGSCLNKFGENYQKYMSSQLNDKQIAAFWNCTAETITEFARVTEGDRAGGAYSPKAVWRFLHKYYFVSQHIDADLLASIMEIKRLIVGGSSTLITEPEVYRLIQFIGEVKTSTIEMRPHIGVLMGSQEKVDPKQLAEAKAAMAVVIRRLAMWVEQQKQTYTFEQMRDLMVAFAHNSSDPESWKSWIGGVQLLAQAKVVTVNLPAEAIVPGQWGPFFNTVGTALGMLLDWKHNISGHVIESLAKPHMRNVAGSLVGIIEQGVKMRGKGGGIPLEEFDKLLIMVGKAGWLGTTVKEDALVKAFRWTMARLFTPRITTRVLPQIALFEGSNIQLMRQLLGDWQALADYSMSGVDHSGSSRVFEFMSVKISAWPLLVDKYGRTTYPDVGETRNYDVASQLVLSWQFLVMSWLRDSYVPDGQKEWNADNMKMTVAEVLPLIQNFGYLVQQVPDIYKRIMKEGDLFMAGSDGNLSISTTEATQYFNGFISAVATGFVWDAVVGTNCGEPADISCYRDVLYLQKDLIVAQMPRLKKFFASMTLEQWREVFLKIETTALGQPEATPWDFGDRNLVWLMMDYLENFMTRYDSNQNETISLAESDAVYKTFAPNLEVLFSASGMPKEDMYPTFTYIMKKGKTYFNPNGDQIEFIYWKRHPEEWPFESDRTVLINILFELSQMYKIQGP